jgi:hypothetical protein
MFLLGKRFSIFHTGDRTRWIHGTRGDSIAIQEELQDGVKEKQGREEEGTDPAFFIDPPFRVVL